MLKKLNDACYNLKPMLDNCRWNGIIIDSEPPTITRIWTAYDGMKICLHKIYPSLNGVDEPFLHPHPWPCATKILKGTYEMKMGCSTTLSPPSKLMPLVISVGSSYEMSHEDMWHSINPIDDIVYSIMLIGKKWDRKMPKKHISPPRMLDKIEKEHLINEFSQLESLR